MSQREFQHKVVCNEREDHLTNRQESNSNEDINSSPINHSKKKINQSSKKRNQVEHSEAKTNSNIKNSSNRIIPVESNQGTSLNPKPIQTYEVIGKDDNSLPLSEQRNFEDSELRESFQSNFKINTMKEKLPKLSLKGLPKSKSKRDQSMDLETPPENNKVQLYVSQSVDLFLENRLQYQANKIKI